MSEWSSEANRLLDEWAEAQAEINALLERASEYRKKLELANDRAREARTALDRFMHGCMAVRAQAIAPAIDPPTTTI